MMPAGTTSSLAHRLTHKEGHFLGIEVQVIHQSVIDEFHLLGPVRLSIVTLALMQQDTLDDTRLLGYLSHIDHPLVRIVVVGFEIVLQPVGLILDIASHLLRDKAFDLRAAECHVNDTHLYVLRQVSHHRTSEIVSHTQSCALTHKGRCGGIPLTHLTLGTCKIHTGQHLETRIHRLVLCLWGGITLHVRLSETEIDVELRLILRILFLLFGVHREVFIRTGGKAHCQCHCK